MKFTYARYLGVLRRYPNGTPGTPGVYREETPGAPTASGGPIFSPAQAPQKKKGKRKTATSFDGEGTTTEGLGES